MGRSLTFFTAAIIFLAFNSCGKGTGSSDTCTSGTDKTETVTMLNSTSAISCTTNISSDAPAWIKDNFHCVTVKVCSDTYVFTTNDLPPYKTAYYSSSSGKQTTFPS